MPTVPSMVGSYTYCHPTPPETWGVFQCASQGYPNPTRMSYWVGLLSQTIYHL
ncbi:MAG: hypothetical protein KAI83_12910 [Thiomargarita sp.]|nr:hypothetical protein [Thiomargarita sp.]